MRQISNRKPACSWQKKKKKKKHFFFSLKLPKVKLSKSPRLPRIKFAGKPLFAAIAFATLVFLCAYFAIFSDYFAIKNITISGNESIKKSKIEETANYVLSAKKYGYVPGNSFLFADEGEISNKLRENFSEIEKVEALKTFPNKLEITIKEKNPALIWCRANCYFVNGEGTAFLAANEQEMLNQKKHFIKVIEEKDIVEEKQEGSPSDSIFTSASAQSGSEIHAIAQTAPDSKQDMQSASSENSADVSDNFSEITPNEKVSDKNFIKFTVDINSKMSYNSKLKIKYYKTKGTKTRELIAFTDRNTRIYFDATKDAQKQVDTLAEFLDKGVEKDEIDGIKYIYLKNNDRVYYK